MKKRLRKKQRSGEFQELGFEVTYSVRADSPDDAVDELLWSFIQDAIEANGLLAGGGCGRETSVFVTSSEHLGSATEEHRALVGHWLASQSIISRHTVHPLRDAWHGWAE